MIFLSKLTICIKNLLFASKNKKKIKIFKISVPPGAPSSATLEVSSENSLFVQFSPPDQQNHVVTRYKGIFHFFIFFVYFAYLFVFSLIYGCAFTQIFSYFQHFLSYHRKLHHFFLVFLNLSNFSIFSNSFFFSGMVPRSRFLANKRDHPNQRSTPSRCHAFGPRNRDRILRASYSW